MIRFVRGRRQVAETRMWPDFVVASTPSSIVSRGEISGERTQPIEEASGYFPAAAALVAE